MTVIDDALPIVSEVTEIKSRYGTETEAVDALTDLYWKFPDNEVVSRRTTMLVVRQVEDDVLIEVVFYIAIAHGSKNN